MNTCLDNRPVIRSFVILCLCVYAISPFSAAYGGAEAVRVFRVSASASNINTVFSRELVRAKLSGNKTHDVALRNRKRAITAGGLIGDPLLEGGRVPDGNFPEGRIAWFPPRRDAGWHLLSIHPIHSPPAGVIALRLLQCDLNKV